MSTVRCACPNCRKAFTVPEEIIGRQGICPKCRALLTVKKMSGRTILELAEVDGDARTKLYVERGPELEEVDVEIVEPNRRRFWTTNKKAGCFAFSLVALLASCLISPVFFLHPREDLELPQDDRSNRQAENESSPRRNSRPAGNVLTQKLGNALMDEVRQELGKADAEIDCTIFQTDFWTKKRKRLPNVKIPSFSILWVYHQPKDQTLLIWLVPDEGRFPRVRQILQAPLAGTVADMEEYSRTFREGMKNARQQNGMEDFAPKFGK